MKRLWNNIRRNLYGFLGFAFCVVMPLVLLGEVVTLAYINIEFKLTFWGSMACAILFFALYKRLKRQVEKLNNLIVKECFYTGLRCLWWGIGLAVMFWLAKVIDKMQAYWWRVGACFLIGSCFYLLYAYKKQQLAKLCRERERESLKAEIKKELSHGNS